MNRQVLGLGLALFALSLLALMGSTRATSQADASGVYAEAQAASLYSEAGAALVYAP